MKKLVLICLSVLFLFASCTHKEKMQKTSSTETKTETTSGGSTTVTTNTGPSPDQQKVDTNMRLVVSFISIGAGTDYKAKEEYDKLVSDDPKKPKYDETRWGREGEVDYCFTLSEMAPKEQDDFVKKTKDLLGNNKLVIITENSPCIHKH